MPPATNSVTPLTTDVVAFGYEVLYQLVRYFGLVGLVNRNYDGTPAFVGQKLTVPSLNFNGKARRRDVDGGVQTDPLIGSFTTVEMFQMVTAFQLDALQMQFSNVDLRTEGAMRAAQTILEGVDDELFNEWTQFYNFVGPTDGSPLLDPSTNNFVNLVKARKVLSDEKVRDRARWRGVLNTTEAANMASTPLFLQAQQAGTARNQEGLPEGYIGRYHDFTLTESQGVPTDVVLADAVTWGTPLIKTDQVIGAAVIDLKGLAHSVTLPKGSLFKIGGKNYSVVADAAVDAGGNAVGVSISPELRVAVLTNDPVTPIPFDVPVSINHLFHPEAYLFVNRPPVPMTDGAGTRFIDLVDNEVGVAMRMAIETRVVDPVRGYQEFLAFDLVMGKSVVRKNYGLRGHGQV
jgi:hypothetical protein